MSQPGLPDFPSVDQAALLAARDAAENAIEATAAIQLCTWALLFVPARSNADWWSDFPRVLNLRRNLKRILAASRVATQAIPRELVRAFELGAAAKLPTLTYGTRCYTSAYGAVLEETSKAVQIASQWRGMAHDPIAVRTFVAFWKRTELATSFARSNVEDLRSRILQEWAAATAMIGSVAIDEESDVFQPIAWFQQNLRPKLEDSTFRKAAIAGRLRTTSVGNKKLYSVAGARRIWPDRFHN